MTEKLHTTIQRQDGNQAIKLAGVIDEDNRLTDLAEKLGGGRAVIDLGDIERINSCGTRDWVNWIAQLEARGVEPVLVECSPAIVAQLNLVKNFSGGAVVKSFYIPYHCPECDEEKVLLVEVADLGPPPHEPPTCRCDECESVMDFDDMPDAYFAFLSAKNQASAQGLDQEMARGSAPPLKVRSRTSQPVLVTRRSSPSLSVYQRPASEPAADREASSPEIVVTHAAPKSRAASTPIIIAVVVLLAAIAALTYLLITG